MRWNPFPLPTLRARLLGLLLPGMALVLALSLWSTHADAVRAANAAFDRSLLGAIKGLDLNVSTASGGLSVEQPYRLFEFFQLTAAGAVHYRVATDDGLVEIGSPDLPLPPGELQPGTPAFFDAQYFGESVRVGALKRVLMPPVGQARHVVIQVAESTASRTDFARAFVSQALWRDALVLGLLGVAVVTVSAWALKPVQRLAEATRRRAPEDLGPLAATGLPDDLLPLVAAINQQLSRTAALVAQRREFLDDASHQLRTPLTTLRAQLDYALRESDPGRMRAALQALSEELDHAARATNQLLLLARADAGALHLEPLDLAELARDVARSLLPLARSLQVDLGVEADDSGPTAPGDRAQLREALLNLTHNALLHGGAGGHVTIEAVAEGTGWRLSVTDTGPGLSPDMRERVGQRFAKGRSSRGAGLGLAMAQAVAERHGGQLRWQPGPNRTGLVMTMLWGPR